MKNIAILAIFVLFIVYTIAEVFVEIPKVFNNIFYGIVSLGALYFCVFHLNLGSEIKNRLKENRRKLLDKKEKKDL